MKKIALALLCVFATGSAAAQTYACQFIMSAGMLKDPKSGWKVTGFEIDEPFFLTMSNGLIDTKSVVESPLNFSSFAATCNKYDLVSLTFSHWCADYSKYLSFDEKTLNGGFARTFGAMQSSSSATADSVSVARFKCQKVR
jgi:hypothetical protein